MSEPLNAPQDTILEVGTRKIAVRQLSFLERHRLFRALGPKTDQGNAFLADCLMFSSVRSIDGNPPPPPSAKSDVEGIISALGDDGCEAVQEWFAGVAVGNAGEEIADAKN